MSPTDQQLDQRFDACLRQVGEHLPEPAPSQQTRDAIAAMAAHDPCSPELHNGTRPVRAHRRFFGARVRVPALGALAAAAAIASGVLFIQNERLQERLDATRAALVDLSQRQAQAPQTGPGLHLMGDGQAELMVVNVHHDRCRYACEVTPKFQQLADRYRDRRVLFVTLDLTDSSQAQAIALAQRFGLTELLEPAQHDHATGVVSLVSTDDGSVLASVDGAHLDEIESRLTTCERMTPPDP